MAEEVKAKPLADVPTPAPAKMRWWKSVLVRRWLAVLIVGSLVVHGVVFVLLRKSNSRAAVQPEFTVGTFAIAISDHGDAHLASGKFDLHVRFVDDLDSSARTRITSHQFRVRESIEGLLRNSQGLQLDEPALTRLKHEIQERIDDAIDLRAVAEVLITDLDLPLPADAPATKPVSAPAAETKPVTAPAAETSAIPTASTANGILGY